MQPQKDHATTSLGNLPICRPAQLPGRSREGCWTCREKKVKCDEQRPRCRRCFRLNRDCDYAPRPRKKYIRAKVARKLPASGLPHPTDGDDKSENRGPEVSSVASQSSGTRACGRGNRNKRSDSRDQGWVRDGDTAITTTAVGDEEEMAAATNPEADSPSTVSPIDHEAINCFRTVVTATVDTKDAEYSVPSIVYGLAQTNSMVMHMVCALGCQQLCYDGEWPHSVSGKQLRQSRAVKHYGTAMRLLGQAIHDTAETDQLDTVMATLWLMILYEQKFGDGSGVGLNAHLKGAASVLHTQLRNLRRLLNWDEVNPSDGGSMSVNEWPISPFVGRMVVWISFLDAGAAFFGLGGHFNSSLGEVMAGLAEDAVLSRLRGFACIHRYSASICRAFWGSSYPQNQLLEDMENRQIFYLYGECGQLRFFLSRLAKGEDAELAHDLARALRDVGERYAEHIEVAGQLNYHSAGQHQRKSITNIRFVVPFYHAAVVCYFCIASRNAKTNERQKTALRGIISLAYQIQRDEGEAAMVRIAWPLFIAALHSTDPVHRDWILARFSQLQSQGENYRRAYGALRAAHAEWEEHQRESTYLDLIARTDIESFVI